MDDRGDFIRRIVSGSGIVTAKGRRDLERELHAHLEDAMEEARAQGCDEAAILQTVCERFGEPGEIAREFANSHAFENKVALLANAVALMGISMLAVSALILTLQLAIAICSGVSVNNAFPRLREETLGFGSLVLGYMGVYLGERLFLKRALIKACAANSAVFAALFILTSWTLHLTVPAAVLAFTCGAAVRVLQQTVIRPVWFLGTAAPFVAAALFGTGDSHFALGIPGLIRWTGLTGACYLLTLLSRTHQRILHSLELKP